MNEQELFQHCLIHARDERERILARECDDERLRERVRRLLAAHDRATKYDSVIPAPPDIKLDEPEYIGPYRVLDKLGEGGMGVVYLAEQKKPVRRKVAIKIVRPGMASAEVINRFNAERQALALMAHPGISRILDAGSTDNKLPYFVMEYVPGTPLIMYCNQHRLALRHRVILARHICLAVQHAHQKGVIHRDLKPSNILVVEDDGEPLPKIIDFGIAKAISQPLTDATLHTRIGKLIGTPDYMSPEQCDPGTMDVDTRSDVYSLGVLLYQLLSSQLPYNFDHSKDNEITILRRIVEEDPPPPSRRAREATAEDAENRGLGDAYSLERRLRGELDWIIGKALERDRNRRYASAQELADDLQRYLDNEPVTASPPSIGYRAGKFMQRHALGVSLLASTFLLVSGFAVALGWQLEQTRRERDRANTEAEIARMVTDFTAGLFALAAPGESGTSDISARELLDLGVRRLDMKTAEDMPRVRAALLEAAGSAYLDLGIETEAESLLQEALALYRGLPGEVAPGEITTMTSLARLHTRRGQWDIAREIEEKAIQRAQALETDMAWPRLRAVTQYATTLRRSGNTEMAASILAPYVLPIEEESIYRPIDIASAMAAYGQIQGELGNFESAIELLEEALVHYKRILGSSSNQANITRGLIANILVTIDQPERAAALHRESLESAIALYGAAHREVAAAWNDLGLTLAAIPAKRDEALTAYTNALKISETLFEPLHPHILAPKSNMAILYRKEGRLDEALTLYRELLDAFERLYGNDHVRTANTMSGIAAVYMEQGKFNEAMPLMDSVIEIYSKGYGPRHWRTASKYHLRGVVQLQRQQFDAAASDLELALEIFVESLGENHSRTVSTRERLAELQKLVREQ